MNEVPFPRLKKEIGHLGFPICITSFITDGRMNDEGFYVDIISFLLCGDP